MLYTSSSASSTLFNPALLNEADDADKKVYSMHHAVDLLTRPTRNMLLFGCMHRQYSETTGCVPPVHILCREVQQSNHDAAPKLGIELGLIIDDMHKAFGEVELHMKVGEVGGNAASQPLQYRHVVR